MKQLLDKQNARTQTKTKTCSLHVPPGNQYSNTCHDIDDSQTKNIVFNWNRNGKNRRNVRNAEDLLLLVTEENMSFPIDMQLQKNDKYLASILVICISPKNTWTSLWLYLPPILLKFYFFSNAPQIFQWKELNLFQL